MLEISSATTLKPDKDFIMADTQIPSAVAPPTDAQQSQTTDMSATDTTLAPRVEPTPAQVPTYRSANEVDPAAVYTPASESPYKAPVITPQNYNYAAGIFLADQEKYRNDPAAGFAQTMSQGMQGLQEMQAQLTQEYRDMKSAQLSRTMMALPANSVQEGVPLVYNEWEKAMMADPEIAGPVKAYMEKLGVDYTVLDSLPREKQDAFWNQVFAQAVHSVREKEDNSGIFGKAMDFIGSAIPFNTTYKMHQAEALLGVSLPDMATALRSMPPRERALITTHIAGILNKQSNRAIATGIMEDLVDNANPEDKLKQTKYFDMAIGAQMVAGPAVRILGAMSREIKASNAMVTAARTGNADKSAQAAAAAVQSPDVAKAANIPRDAAASTASPFKNDEILPESVDGIHYSVHEKLGNTRADVAPVRSAMEDIYDNSGIVKVTGDNEQYIVKTMSKDEQARAAKELVAKMKQTIEGAVPDMKSVQILPEGDSYRIIIPYSVPESAKNVKAAEKAQQAARDYLQAITGEEPRALPDRMITADEAADYEQRSFEAFKAKQAQSQPVPNMFPSVPGRTGVYEGVVSKKYVQFQGYEGLDANPLQITQYLGSASRRLRNVSAKDGSTVGNLVENATNVGHVTAVLQTQLMSVLEKVYEGIGGLNPSKKFLESRNKVDAIIKASDEWYGRAGKGRRFTEAELTAGIHVPGVDEPIVLNHAERVAYYRYAELGDNAWRMANSAAIKEESARGKKFINLGTDSRLGRVVYDLPEDMTSVLVHRGDTGYTTVARSKFIEKYPGYSFVRLDEPVKNPFKKVARGAAGEAEEAHTVNYIAVKNDLIEGLEGKKLIRQRDFHMPMVNDGIRHVIKRHVSGSMDGKSMAVNKMGKTAQEVGGARSTVALIRASLRDAKEEVARLNAEVADNPNVHYSLTSDHEASYVSKYGLAAHSGLGADARTADDILREVAGAGEERLPPAEAMSRYMDKLSKVYPIAEYRAQMIGRTETTVRNLMGKPHWQFGDDIDVSIHPNLHYLQEYVKAQLQIQTKAEREFGYTLRRVSEFVELHAVPFLERYVSNPESLRNFGRELTKRLDKFGKLGPVHQVKAAAFHLLLGCFNPSGYIVQAQAGVYAMTMATAQLGVLKGSRVAAAAAKDAFIARFALSNRPARDAIINRAIATGLVKKDFKEMIDAFERTGMYHSIKNSADYDALVKGLPGSMTTAGKLLDHGLLFFKEGELISRMTAFSIEWAKAREGMGLYSSLTGDAKIARMMSEAQKNMLNLSTFNKAPWQDGLLGLPTQFWQVQAKMVEELIGDRLNITQKLMLMISQIAMYGGSGYTMKQVITSAYQAGKEAMGMGSADEPMGEREKAFVTRGFLGMLVPDMDISSRGTMVPPIFDAISSFIYDDHGTAARQYLGASATLFKRGEDLLDAAEVLTAKWGSDGEPVTIDDFSRVADKIAAMSSTWTNAEKFYSMYTMDKVFNSYGKPVADNFNPVEMYGQLIGFTPARVAELGELTQHISQRDAFRKNRVGDILHMYDNYIVQNPEEQKRTLREISLAMDLWFPDKAERMQAAKEVWKGLLGMSGKTKEDKMRADWAKKQAQGMEDSLRDAYLNGGYQGDEE